MEDYVYEGGAMANAISELEASKAEMDNKMEAVKSTLRDNLLQAGMTGQAADALLETFRREVVQPAEEYMEVATNYIKQNSEVKEAMDANINKTVNIAGN